MTTYPSRTLPELTDRKRLPGGAISVSPFCLGIAHAPELVREAHRAGINFFFVSVDLHLTTYLGTVLGIRELLRTGEATRDDIVVASVSYVENPAFFEVAIPELLMLLPELEYVDVAVAGGCSLQSYADRRRTLLGFKETGLVQAVGATFHSRDAALLAITRDELDVAFVRYNPSHPGARDDLFPFVERSSTLIYNFVNGKGYPGSRWDDLGLDESYWRPEYTDYYRFALSQPRVDGILCAPRDIAELRAISPRLRLGPLDGDEQGYLQDLAAIVEGRATIDEYAAKVIGGRPR